MMKLAERIDEMKDNRMDNMVNDSFEKIVQGYLESGYNRATAEMMAREFFRYDS